MKWQFELELNFQCNAELVQSQLNSYTEDKKDDVIYISLVAGLENGFIMNAKMENYY